MRSKRFRKYKTNHRLWPIGIQMFALIYILMAASTYLIGSTSAAFNDIEKLSFSLHTKWETEDEPNCTQKFGEWDCSSLEWVEEDQNQHGYDSDKHMVYSHIQYSDGEKSNPMTKPWALEVYYSAIKGKPDWEKIDEGVIDVFEVGTVQKITFEPTHGEGRYRFKFIRPEGHPGGSNGGFSPTMKFVQPDKETNSGDNQQENNEIEDQDMDSNQSKDKNEKMNGNEKDGDHTENTAIDKNKEKEKPDHTDQPNSEQKETSKDSEGINENKKEEPEGKENEKRDKQSEEKDKQSEEKDKQSDKDS